MCNKDSNRQNENQRHIQLLKKAFEKAVRDSPGQTDLEHSKRKVMEAMQKYVSERIVNIADLEQKLQSAHIATLSALKELQKENPSIQNIEGLLRETEKILTESINFEFEIERRITTDNNGVSHNKITDEKKIEESLLEKMAKVGSKPLVS